MSKSFTKCIVADMFKNVDKWSISKGKCTLNREDGDISIWIGNGKEHYDIPGMSFFDRRYFHKKLKQFEIIKFEQKIRTIKTFVEVWEDKRAGNL